MKWLFRDLIRYLEGEFRSLRLLIIGLGGDQSEYFLVVSYSMGDFLTDVNTRVDDGWKALGQPYMLFDNGGTVDAENPVNEGVFIQAMVR